MTRKILTLLGVICVPIVLALVSQSLVTTAEPPQLPHEPLEVRLDGPGGGATPSESTEPTGPAAPGRESTGSAVIDAGVPAPAAPGVGEVPYEIQQDPRPLVIPDLDTDDSGDVDDMDDTQDLDSDGASDD